jgi:uncharacterized repeat protein (TIGR01451 family)
VVFANDGLCAEAELTTHIEMPGYSLLVEVEDTEDPVEVGGHTTYTVRITNAGSKAETNITLAAQIPAKMQFETAHSPTRYRAERRTVLFEPLGTLAQWANAVFRIKVKALEAGTAVLLVHVNCTGQTERITRTESTRIYVDETAPAGSPGR